MTTLIIHNPDAMHEFGKRLGEQLRAGDLVLLTGPLGAGKTTLTRGIGEGMNVRGTVTSPTFVLARTHRSNRGGAALVHVDAYRLADRAELEDLDIDFVSSVVVAEWGDGLIDTGAEWLHLFIERPLGTADAGKKDAAAQSSQKPAAPANCEPIKAATPLETMSAGESWDEKESEPRIVTLHRHGQR